MIVPREEAEEFAACKDRIALVNSPPSRLAGLISANDMAAITGTSVAERENAAVVRVIATRLGECAEVCEQIWAVERGAAPVVQWGGPLPSFPPLGNLPGPSTQGRHQARQPDAISAALVCDGPHVLIASHGLHVKESRTTMLNSLAVQLDRTIAIYRSLLVCTHRGFS